MTSQKNLDYAQALPDLVSEHGADYDAALSDWEKQMDADAAYLNSQFNQGFYFGSRDQARFHKWYVLLGLIAGGLLGWML